MLQRVTTGRAACWPNRSAAPASVRAACRRRRCARMGRSPAPPGRKSRHLDVGEHELEHRDRARSVEQLRLLLDVATLLVRRADDRAEVLGGPAAFRDRDGRRPPLDETRIVVRGKTLGLDPGEVGIRRETQHVDEREVGEVGGHTLVATRVGQQSPRRLDLHAHRQLHRCVVGTDVARCAVRHLLHRGVERRRRYGADQVRLERDPEGVRSHERVECHAVVPVQLLDRGLGDAATGGNQRVRLTRAIETVGRIRVDPHAQIVGAVVVRQRLDLPQHDRVGSGSREQRIPRRLVAQDGDVGMLDHQVDRLYQ